MGLAQFLKKILYVSTVAICEADVDMDILERMEAADLDSCAEAFVQFNSWQIIVLQ